MLGLFITIFGSLFIYNGVHRSEFSNENEIIDLINKYGVTTKFYQAELNW